MASGLPPVAEGNFHLLSEIIRLYVGGVENMARWFEFLVVVVLFSISLPIRGVVCFILFIQMGRPLMFRQARVGQGGRRITVAKLRTMTDGRDAAGQLLPDAMRQTRLTALVRRLRLDELPQLDMILRGDMALVGPRPLLARTLAGFGMAAAMQRCAVRPGLTGWAQVSGNTRLSEPEKLALDLWYVAHRSTALDLRILIQTVGVALGGERRHEARVRQALDWLAGRSDAAPDMAGVAT